MKKLYLLRHAKTEPGAPGRPDNERHLTEGGARECRQLGIRFASNGGLPDIVLCSPAMRTVETLAHTLQATGHPPMVRTEFLRNLYLPSPEQILTAVGLVDASLSSALVITHNPGVGELARELAGIDVQELDDYPTAGLAAFDCDVDEWGKITPSVCKLASFFAPKPV